MRGTEGKISGNASRITQLRNARIATVDSENARILPLHFPLQFPASRVPWDFFFSEV